MKNVFMFILFVLVALLSSCEKPQLVDDMGNEISRSEAIRTLDAEFSNASATSRAANDVMTITINGESNRFELERDHYYDDGADEFVHFSQTYDRRMVIGQDVDGNDIEERVIVYFDILVNTDSGSFEGGEVVVESHNTTFNLNSNSFTSISDGYVSYDDGSLSFRLDL